MDLNISPKELSLTAVKYKRTLLMLTILSMEKTTKWMNPLANIRGKMQLGSMEAFSQFAPYKTNPAGSKDAELKFREIETFLGNAVEKFDPNLYATTILAQTTPLFAKDQKKDPLALLVLSAVAKSLGRHLEDAIFDAKRNPEGTTSKDLFNGFNTIAEADILAGNIAAPKNNLHQLAEKITEANALDIAAEIEESCTDELQDQQKILFCSREFLNLYNKAYAATRGGVAYNTQYNQTFIEGSDNRTTIVALPQLRKSDKFYVTTKENMCYGFDAMSDKSTVKVGEYSSFGLEFGAAMFFGTQFQTIDPRFFNVIKLHQEP